ncbi:MAG TPA: Rieske 2Fe-2S domain-containing protein [Acidimicrobiales bacterium]|nr:Rieske 2Fe-2S domain-containing protein [Acidimicrobiales bacterium]
MLPLRGFLGFTFVFAGLQKLANPGFFDASNPASIQAQLAGAQRASPIHGLLGPLSHVSILVGLVIAFAEVAIGLATLFGFMARVAAAGGLLLSFMLFLTVSYHSHPYYTGSDIVFMFAWVPLVIAGAGGVLSADTFLAQRARVEMGAEPIATVPVSFAVVRRVCGQFDNGRCKAQHGAPCAPAPCPFLAQQPDRTRRMDQQEMDRRTMLATGGAAAGLSAAVLLGGGTVAGLGRLAGGSGPSGKDQSTPTLGGATAAGQRTGSTTTPSSSAPATSTSAPPPTTAPSRPAGTKIGPASGVPVGGAASFQDPSSGDPSLVVQPAAGTFVAFDAVCPHAGCTVEYYSSQRLFICPCHGSEFNGRTGSVEVGPAQRGLTQLHVAEGSDGDLYVS